MFRYALASARMIIGISAATLCLFGYPIVLKWLLSTNNLELVKSVAAYSLGVIALLVIAKAFRSLDKNTAKFFDEKPASNN